MKKTLVAMILFAACLCSFTVNAKTRWSDRECGALSADADQSMAKYASKNIGVERLAVIGEMLDGEWFVLNVRPDGQEDAFLFYRNDPSVEGSYVGLWSGFAASEDRALVESYLNKNMLGIPSRLAFCFSVYVSNGNAWPE